MSKKLRKGLCPEDIVEGTVVIYHGDKRGVVKDAFAPLNQFWVASEKTKQLVRDASGEIVSFRAEELQLAETTAVATAAPARGSSARVMVIGTESQMLQVLERFGTPDALERRDPQQLLALPCPSCHCDPGCARFEPYQHVTCSTECPLLKQAADGIDETLQDLAWRLRPDLQPEFRAYHLKQALEQVGPELLRLEGYYCLSAVTLPYSGLEIAAATGWDKHWMQDVRNQIDLDVAAEAYSEAGESLKETAVRALREWCHLRLEEDLWEDEVQLRLRHALGVDLPLSFWDGREAKVFVLLLPAETVSSAKDGLLCFGEDPNSKPQAVRGASSDGKPAAAGRPEALHGGKTIAQWRAEQDQFKDLPKLPEGWLRIKSRSNNTVYYYNTRTNTSTFDFPLPEGWTMQKSKTTGKVYYFNAKLRKSSFEIPTE